jgi:hypothetical protein
MRIECSVSEAVKELVSVGIFKWMIRLAVHGIVLSLSWV